MGKPNPKHRQPPKKINVPRMKLTGHVLQLWNNHCKRCGQCCYFDGIPCPYLAFDRLHGKRIAKCLRYPDHEGTIIGEGRVCASIAFAKEIPADCGYAHIFPERVKNFKKGE